MLSRTDDRTIARRARALLALALTLCAAAGAGQAQPSAGDLATRRYYTAHLLRRIGFGPDSKEMHRALALGLEAYFAQQLYPELIDDSAAEAKFRPEPQPNDDPSVWTFRWYTRMVHSRRQLQEKMTLLWHELFATSVNKVGYFTLMRDQEELFRRHALGSFRQLLIDITRDNAMLIFLDNAYNNGQAYDGEGKRIPPNENYARELLQLFALGVHQLNMDGTPVLDPDGSPLPAYSEDDVKEVARALTGWYPQYPPTFPEDPTTRVGPALFNPDWHDPDGKLVLGSAIPPAAGFDGAADVDRVVDILMRQPTMAPFIAKQLIQKLATETPSPAYVARVAAVFAATSGDLRATVLTIVGDAEFWSDAVIRTQYKTPNEHYVGGVRAVDGRSGGVTLWHWTYYSGHTLYAPPSVFSFYRPGKKSALVNAAYVTVRDNAMDTIANGWVDGYFDTTWNARRLMRRYRLHRRPERAVDVLANLLIGAPLRAEVRRAITAYIGPRVTEEKFRGAAWLIMCSPDFQAN